jgi:hypothetical protein
LYCIVLYCIVHTKREAYRMSNCIFRRTVLFLPFIIVVEV